MYFLCLFGGISHQGRTWPFRRVLQLSRLAFLQLFERPGVSFRGAKNRRRLRDFSTASGKGTAPTP